MMAKNVIEHLILQSLMIFLIPGCAAPKTINVTDSSYTVPDVQAQGNVAYVEHFSWVRVAPTRRRTKVIKGVKNFMMIFNCLCLRNQTGRPLYTLEAFNQGY